MKKLAVFVEGQTEQLFVDRFVNEIAGGHAVAIEHRKVTGGGRSGPRWVRLLASKRDAQQQYFILIVDCAADNRVKSEIRDNYESLISSGYSAIVGIRDVFPEFTYPDIPKLRAMLDYRMKTKPVRVVFVLGVMEIETWFISEYTHFARLDQRLSPAYIKAKVGFDPSTDDMQQRPTPAIDLDDIYCLVGCRYRKDRVRIQRTVDLLDYGCLYLEAIHRLPDLETLVESLDAFLSS